MPYSDKDFLADMYKDSCPGISFQHKTDRTSDGRDIFPEGMHKVCERKNFFGPNDPPFYVDDKGKEQPVTAQLSGRKKKMKRSDKKRSDKKRSDKKQMKRSDKKQMKRSDKKQMKRSDKKRSDKKRSGKKRSDKKRSNRK